MSINVLSRGLGRQARWQLGPSPWSVAGLCLLVAAAFDALLLHETGLSGDEPYYSRIADHPAGPHNFPYAFRVGVPYLVHVLPFSHALSWQLMALVATAVASGALFALLSEFEVPDWLTVWLCVCFSVCPNLLVVFLRNGRSVDAAAIMVITLGSLFIVRRQKLALAVTLMVGATVHESCMFLVPFAYAVWAETWVDPDALRDLALVALLPVLFYVYLRRSIVAVGEAYQPGYEGPFFSERIDVISEGLRAGGWKTELRRLAIAFGPLWLAAPFALPNLRFARRGLVLVACCVASMTIALDWGRAIFFAAPVFYVAGAWALRDRRRLAIAAVIAFVALDVGYAGYMQFYGVTHNLNSTGPPTRGPVH